MKPATIDALSLDDLETLAQARMPAAIFDFVAGGAGTELTLRENRLAFDRLRLLPRVLRNVTDPQLQTTVLGTDISMPILVAPMAFHGLVHRDGELATMKASMASGSIMIASTASSHSLEDIAEAAGAAPRWFQLYVYRDRGLTRSLVERAQAAAYSALCVTVDVPLLGQRRRDIRNRFSLPDNLKLANFIGTAAVDFPKTAQGSGLESYVAVQMDAGVTWQDIDWLSSVSSLPLVLKGIMTPEDALLSAEHGASAIVVSNHGGRQLDGVPATITVLPRVVDSVKGQIEVLLDSGIRQGTDVLKALALGARAVLLGRPILWGLALDGAAGAHYALELIRAELAAALALVGCRSVADLSTAFIWKDGQ
jgi:4-hydroxymandelate oxidase